MQAGLISGNLGLEMGRAIRNGGPLALWNGFVPFLVEALPYDMSELGSYSQLRDTWDHTTQPGGRCEARRQPQHTAKPYSCSTQQNVDCLCTCQ